VQYPVGDRKGFWAPATIPRAEHFVLGISVEGQPDELHYPISPRAASSYMVGQWVSVEYQKRGIPPFWQRSYVNDVKHVDQ
jgi:hypothetical protein